MRHEPVQFENGFIHLDDIAIRFEQRYTCRQAIEERAPHFRFAGDVLFLPKGSVANWHVESYVKKVAFCRRVQPKVIGQALRAASFAKRLLTGRGAAAPAMSLGG